MAELIVMIGYFIICGYIAKSISSKRGMEGGFWWGALLGVIGVIVVAVRPQK